MDIIKNGAGRSPECGESHMSDVVARNIRALTDVRQREQRQRTVSDRIADTVTGFAGTMWFVYLHLLLYGGWLAINSRALPILEPWDPYPFVMLAMAASVEAIFLSTFVLISQNRMQRLADRRAELDLQISLLSEHELTKAIHLLDAVAQKIGVPRPAEQEMIDIKRDVAPEQVAEAIERAEEELEAEKEAM